MRSRDPDQTVCDVGRRVAEVRIQQGLTQARLAEDLGFELKYLQRIEAGRNLTIKSLVRLANTLGIQPTDLFRKPTTKRRGPGRPKQRLPKTSR
jgi:transcriptional regulator with XRE-family HTH domain